MSSICKSIVPRATLSPTRHTHNTDATDCLKKEKKGSFPCPPLDCFLPPPPPSFNSRGIGVGSICANRPPRAPCAVHYSSCEISFVLHISICQHLYRGGYISGRSSPQSTSVAHFREASVRLIIEGGRSVFTFSRSRYTGEKALALHKRKRDLQQSKSPRSSSYCMGGAIRQTHCVRERACARCPSSRAKTKARASDSADLSMTVEF